MRIAVTMLVALVLASCAGREVHETDPINSLVKKLNATNGSWISGIYSPIALPAGSTPATVLDAALKQYGYMKGTRRIATYRIEEVREVKLDLGSMYTFSAILVEADVWRKILLFRQDEEPGQWWTRFYDVSTEEPNTSLHGSTESRASASSIAP